MGWRGWAGWAGLAGLQEGGNEAGHMTPVIWGAGCSELQRTGMPEGPQIAPQNGLGWAGLGWLAGWLTGGGQSAWQKLPHPSAAPRRLGAKLLQLLLVFSVLLLVVVALAPLVVA